MFTVLSLDGKLNAIIQRNAAGCWMLDASSFSLLVAVDCSLLLTCHALML